MLIEALECRRKGSYAQSMLYILSIAFDLAALNFMVFRLMEDSLVIMPQIVLDQGCCLLRQNGVNT